MDVALQYCKCLKTKDLDGLMTIASDDVHFVTPRWEAKGKAALKKQILSNDPPEFYGETELEEISSGKFRRRLKIKVALGMVTVKLQQTITVADGKLVSMVMERQ